MITPPQGAPTPANPFAEDAHMTLDTLRDPCQSDIITCSDQSGAVVSMPEIGRTEIRRGRPRITSERPWDTQGISRSTYYERMQAPIRPTYAPTELRWFCIKLPNLPDAAVLDVDVAIRCLGFETFYPQICVPPVAARRTEAGRAIPATPERLVPLLNSYALVRFDRADPSWRRLAAFGKIMGAAEWPTAIPDGDIAKLRKGLAPNGVKYPDADPEPVERVKKRWVTMLDGLAGLATALQMEAV